MDVFRDVVDYSDTDLGRACRSYAACNANDYIELEVLYGRSEVYTVVEVACESVCCLYCSNPIFNGCVMFRIHKLALWTNRSNGTSNMLDSYGRCCKDCARLKRYDSLFIKVPEMRKRLIQYKCSGSCEVLHMTFELSSNGELQDKY
jgi:hypothetical protein